MTTSNAKEVTRKQRITAEVLKETLENIKITNNANWISEIKNLTTMVISEGFAKVELDIYWKLIPKKEETTDYTFPSQDTSYNYEDYDSDELMCDNQEWIDELYE